MISFFKIILFEPLYNALVILSGLMPGHSIALAIIALTVIVRTLLLPLYHKSLTTQRKLKEIDPLIKKLKEDYKDEREEQARKMMELYREHGINPFTGFVLLLIQLPLILALFYVFSRGFELNLDILYPFVQVPEALDRTVFGWILLTDKSYILAFLVGITQYFQVKFTLPPLPPAPAGESSSFKGDLARSMHMQMRYVMPVIITVIASQFPAAIALYWLTGNLFAVAHELIVRSKAKKLIR